MNVSYTNNSHIQKLEQEYQKIKLERNNLRENLTTMIEEINTINPKFFQQALAQNNFVPQTKEQQTKQKEDNKEQYSKENKIKDMWRQIAASCHPDKTTETWRHELYKLAGDAKTNLDEDAMSHLFLQLCSGKLDLSHQSLISDLIEKLILEITRLKASKLYTLFDLRAKNRILFFYTINSEKP